MGGCCSKAVQQSADMPGFDDVSRPGTPYRQPPSRSRRMSHRASEINMILSSIPDAPDPELATKDLALIEKHEDLVGQFDKLLSAVARYIDEDRVVQARKVVVQIQKSLQAHTLRSKNNKQEEQLWRMAERLSAAADVDDLQYMCDTTFGLLRDLAAGPEQAGQHTWKLDEINIKYNVAAWRKVDDTQGKTGLGTFRFESMFPCGLAAVMAALVSEQTKAKWLPYCRAVENLDFSGMGNHVMHFKVHLPWPLGDRESTTGFRVVNALEDGDCMLVLGSRKAEMLRGHISKPHKATSLDIEYWGMILQPVDHGKQTVVKLITYVNPHASKYPTAVVNKGLLGFFKVLVSNLCTEATKVEAGEYSVISKSAHYRDVAALMDNWKAGKSPPAAVRQSSSRSKLF